MARIMLCTAYDNYAVGLRIIAAMLAISGHDVRLVFFKQNCHKELGQPSESALCYQVIQKESLFGYHLDVNPIAKREEELFLGLVESEKPDLLGYGGRSFLDGIAVGLLGAIRERNPGLKIVAGGYGPTLSPEMYLKHCNAVIIGEGEEAMAEIACAVDAHRPLTSIDNIAWLNQGKLVINPLRKPRADIDAYPLPIYGEKVRFIDDGKVQERDFALDTKYYPLLAGRGCVGTCSYCSAGLWRSIYLNNGVVSPCRRNRSAENVVRELTLARERGFKYFGFIDTYLTGTTHYLKHLYTSLRGQVGMPFSAQLHHKQLMRDPGMLDLACAAGLNATSIGIQSGSERFAREVYKRRISNIETIAVSKMFLERDVRLNYHILAGNPLETEMEIDDSLDMVSKLPRRLEKDFITTYQLKLFPRSPLGVRVAKAKATMPSAREWFWQANLYALRWVLNDASFAKVRRNVKLRESPAELYMMMRNLYVGRSNN